MQKQGKKIMSKRSSKWMMGLIMAALTALIIQPLFDAGVVAADETIKIGCFFPLTGRAGRAGADGVAAATIAVEEINKKGGVLGKKFELLVTDDKSDPAYAVRVARRYITSDKVNFLMGTVSSAVALAVSEVAKENKVIFICTGAASSRITIQKWHPYVFNTCSITTWASRAGAFLAQKKPEWKKYWSICPDYEYGHTLSEEFFPFLKKMRSDVELVGESWPKLFEPDYSPYITAILKARPDVVFGGFWGGDSVAFIKQAIPYGFFEKVKFLAPDSTGQYELFETMKESMPAGLILGSHCHLNFPDTQVNKEHIKKLQEKLGRYPIANITPHCEAGVKMLARAIEKVGSVKKTEALIKAMEGMKIITPLDPPGYTSWIRPLTHNLVYPYAIGISEKNDKYPPAKYMLGNFEVFSPEKIDLSDEEVVQLRATPK